MAFLWFLIITSIAFGGAIVCVYYASEPRRKRLESQEAELEAQASELLAQQEEINATKNRLHEAEMHAAAVRKQLESDADRFRQARSEFESKIIAYTELVEENSILKRDLRNMAVNVQKLQLDVEQRRQAQEALDSKIEDLGQRYLKENIKWISSSLSPNNFVSSKQRLQDVIERCRGIQLEISTEQEAAAIANLKEEYEKVVRAAFEHEEQIRIRAQIREEMIREKEIERELKQLEREREAIKAALEKALADARGQHSEEVERLKARLAEAEAKSQRAISQAQLTKSGRVYVISNIGSFGEGVFKVGLTRRLEPEDRIQELSGASVPFPFDVHMMIAADDAPALEAALHRKLHKMRVNKVNPRKEFFKTDIKTITEIVKDHHGEVEYIADAEALEYRQSLNMLEEDQEYIESLFGDLDEDAIGVE
jgi:hypothetical protein